jgi:shikimate kinase
MFDVNSLNKTLVLVGMMGAGKTTIGTRLAKRLNLEFIDTDAEVEKKAKCSITDIFKYESEQYFRELEKSILSNLLTGTPYVLATGGNTFIDPENRQLIKEKAISIWLKADLEVLVERVSRRNTRPALERGDKREILTSYIAERYPIYAQADLTIVSDNAPHQVIVTSIIKTLEEYLNK